jgi:ribosomal protein S18 acetylase RimI-like enzyme
VNNEGAIKFYEKFGFKIVERKENYYKRIQPADAFVLEKDLRVSKENGVVEESS